jgi:hypothetical protein
MQPLYMTGAAVRVLVRLSVPQQNKKSRNLLQATAL